MKSKIFCCLILALCGAEKISAQKLYRQKADMKKQVNKKAIIAERHLFQYGIASSFIEGIYEGELTMKQLKQYGDFGIGAPNLIDGELTVIDGVAYQSNAQGKTTEAAQELRTPFAFVTTFSSNQTITLTDVKDLKDLFNRVELLLPDRNTIYAIHIKGNFSAMRTRAFPPVQLKPFKPLSQMLERQRFFKLNDTGGDMVGFYFPNYLSGLNITGLHFHFLSNNRDAGGHVIEAQAKYLIIEISKVQGFRLQIPGTEEFKNYEFSGSNSPGLEKVEKGKD